MYEITIPAGAQHADAVRHLCNSAPGTVSPSPRLGAAAESWLTESYDVAVLAQEVGAIVQCVIAVRV